MLYLLVLLTLIFSFRSAIVQSTCNKTQQQLDQNQQHHHQLILPFSPKTSNSSPPINNQTNCSKVHYQREDIEDELDDLDILRLEYNKYKILSNLGITTDPDLLAPNMTAVNHTQLLTRAAATTSDTDRHQITSNLRQKRSLACSEIKSNKDACCLETFYVNFTEIGWDKWILYPAGYNANYCRGQCDLSHARYYHSTLLSKFSHVIGLCCSPRQMAPLRLLYIDDNNKVHQKSMPDMIVEGCDCA